MTSTALLSTVGAMPHLPHPIPPAASIDAPSDPDAMELPAPRKRPRSLRRPPPLQVPQRPPTSLPNSFYCDAETRTAAHTDRPQPQPADARAAPPPPVVPAALQWRGDARTAAHTRKGRMRRQNEDRVFAHDPSGVYGVCDGHGGDVAADTVANRFPMLMAQRVSLVDAFAAVEAEVCAHIKGAIARIPCPLQNPMLIGTTLVAVQIQRGQQLRVAHVGDSRAMLIDRTGSAIMLTEDHSPERPDEVARIERTGGMVVHGRVNGMLAVSRAIGDMLIKAQVIAVPEVSLYQLSADDQLVVLASDGLWDMVSDVEVATFLKSVPLQEGSIAVPLDLEGAAEQLVKMAVERGSRDDISVVVVDVRDLNSTAMVM